MTIEFKVGTIDIPKGTGKFVVTTRGDNLSEGRSPVVRYSACNNPRKSILHMHLVEKTNDDRCIGGGEVVYCDSEKMLFLFGTSTDYGPAPKKAIDDLTPAIIEAYRNQGLTIDKIGFSPSCKRREEEYDRFITENSK